MRLREDELWVRRIQESLPKGLKNNLHMIDLNLKDAPIRLRIPDDALDATPVNPADPSIDKIRKALTRQSELGAIEALVVPAALGNHIDHLTVREAAQPFTAQLPSAFYEDLPYAATHARATADLEALRTAAITRNEPLTEILCRTNEPAAEAKTRKRKLILNYASQIDDEIANLITDFATRYNTAERLWANKKWLSAFTST
jgi:LmbE family N-acetylglucosaminyl deacetylase